MANLFERLAAGRPRQNGENPTSQSSLNWLQHDSGRGPMENDQARQEQLEARLDTLIADLRRFCH